MTQRVVATAAASGIESEVARVFAAAGTHAFVVDIDAIGDKRENYTDWYQRAGRFAMSAIESS